MGACPRRLLVVEDNPDHALLVKKVLEPWAKAKGSVIDYSTSISDALQKLAKNSFDLILTDYQLPDKTGLDFLNEIKDRKLEIPMVLMTGVGDEMLAVNALKSGFLDYLIKDNAYFQKLPAVIENAYERYVNDLKEKKHQQELLEKNIHLSTLNRKLSELTIHDELTGLYNHRFLQAKATEELARAVRYHHPLSCLMVDIDHFKVINDSHGHPAGDQILKELSRLLRANVREVDTIARYGGEEFLILLPHTNYAGTQVVAERIRKQVMDHSFEVGRHPVQVTASIGVASYPEDAVERKDTLLLFADKALYRAKGSGRNKVCFYHDLSREFSKEMPDMKIENARLADIRQRLFDISELAKRAYIEATKALVNALEIKDPHTLGHASRVAHYSALVAQEMGYREDEVRIIEHGGLLHDIGKICIPDEILLKPSAFNQEEYERMKAHPLLGYQIVKPIKFLAEEAVVILYHHEWFNGEGYPYRLKGREIPSGARIVSVVDAYDTMVKASGRYKKLMTSEEAAGELIECAGTQFDPEVVASMIQLLIKRKELNPEIRNRQKLDILLKPHAA